MSSPKGIFAAAVALVACPCHLPITLPLLLVLTSGSAAHIRAGVLAVHAQGQ